MKKNIPPLKCETFYHIFNRGIDRTNIFLEESIYDFFLKKYVKYISPAASTYAYTLLRNHFHLLIRTRSESAIKQKYCDHSLMDPGLIISREFSHLFNSYAQAFNKCYNRTGGLFETPFRRIAVDDNEYLTRLVYYIHFNAQKHRFVRDFTTYKHCSYPIYLQNNKTFVERKAGIEWFGDREAFIDSHKNWAEARISGDALFPELG